MLPMKKSLYARQGRRPWQGCYQIVLPILFEIPKFPKPNLRHFLVFIDTVVRIATVFCFPLKLLNKDPLFSFEWFKFQLMLDVKLFIFITICHFDVDLEPFFVSTCFSISYYCNFILYCTFNAKFSKIPSLWSHSSSDISTVLTLL